MAQSIFTGQLPAGESTEVIWNNPLRGIAYSFTAEPSCPFDFSGLHSTLAGLEITAVIFEQQFVEWNPPPQGEIAGTPVFHNRIRIKITNTGGQLAGLNLLMATA